MEVGLLLCSNLDSWKPRHYDFRNAKARRYLPSSQLLLANIGPDTITTAAEYVAGYYAPRKLRRYSTVTLHPDSPIQLGSSTLQALGNGTGLRFNQKRATELVSNFEEHDRTRLLIAQFAALGYAGGSEQLHTVWRQQASGRVSTVDPPISNLPRPLRTALEPIHGGITCEIDYRNFEPRILHAEAGVLAPDGDYAAFVGDNIGLSREAVKMVLNPLLHGQTRGNLIGTKQWDKVDHRVKLETFLRSKSPAVWHMIETVQKDDSLLQSRGAQVFFSAYDAAIRAEGLPAGISLHDGWVFPANDEGQLLRVKAIFEETGLRMLGQQMPVNVRIVA